MAVFQSHYQELKFYANSELKSFRGGRYVTENKDEITALEKLVDAVKVEEPKSAAKAEPAEAKAKAPAKKAASKSSAK